MEQGMEDFDKWNETKKDIHTNKNRIHFRQIKTIDAKRLRYKIGNIDKKTFEKLERKFVEFYKLTPQDRGEATLTKSEQRINSGIIPNNTKEVKS